MPLQMNLLHNAKLASTIILVASMNYFCGLKTSKNESATVGVYSLKFKSRRKGKYGLNMQAVCDA